MLIIWIQNNLNETPLPFTWTEIVTSDNTEIWTEVVTTTNSETWTEIAT